MASTWTGANLLDRAVQKAGFSDTTFRTRALEWINDIQEDISNSFDFPEFRFKLKKYVVAGVEELDLSPQIPSAPTSVISAGGSLTDGATYSIKTTFVIFDESGKYENSIESEASTETAVVTGTAVDKTISLTDIDLYDGSTSIKPATIYRRIYVSKNSGSFYLSATITDNTTTTASITTGPTSVVEPPEFSPVEYIADDDLYIEGSGALTLTQISNEEIKRFSPAGNSGSVYYYARLDSNRVTLYPKPSSAITLSYYIQRRPGRIFDNSSSKLQIPPKFKQAMEAGWTWKSWDYKDTVGLENKYQLYKGEIEELKRSSRVNGQFGRVRDVEGDSNGFEV